MSDKLSHVARQMFAEVWNHGNVDLLPQLITPDHANHDPMNEIKGLEAVRQLVTKYRTAFPDLRLDVDDTLTAGDRDVVLRWRYKGTHRGELEGIAPTRRVVSGSGITIFRFEGSLIKEAFTQWDALGMMQQLGVVTLPGKTARQGA